MIQLPVVYRYGIGKARVGRLLWQVVIPLAYTDGREKTID